MIAWKEEWISRISGRFCCRSDRSLTLVSDAKELQGLFGYSPEEIEEKYHNSLFAMADEGCRENFRQQFTEQLAGTGSVEGVFSVCSREGKTVWVFYRGQKVAEASGTEVVAGILIDVTCSKKRYDTEKQAARELKAQAEQDSLTKLSNARTTRKLVEKYLEEEDGECALMIIDLDGFKQINDSYGHMFGDAVLIQAARTIRNLFRSRDIVGRIGGDEFLVLMKDISDRQIVNTRCGQLNKAIGELFAEQLSRQPLSCSVGVAFCPEHGQSHLELFRCADQALYRAKDLGKERYVFYDKASFDETNDRFETGFMDYDEVLFRECPDR